MQIRAAFEEFVSASLRQTGWTNKFVMYDDQNRRIVNASDWRVNHFKKNVIACFVALGHRRSAFACCRQ